MTLQEKISNKTVVTGLSIVSCLGENPDEVWERLCKGDTGLLPIDLFDISRCRSSLGGEVRGDYPVRGFDRMVAFTVKGIELALREAGISLDYVRSVKSAIVLGTSLGHLFENQAGPVKLDEFMPEVLKRFNLNIPYLVVSTACSSGTDAIGNGCDLIEFMSYDLVITGGVDVLDIFKMLGHSSLRTLSPTRCKPYDIQSDGTSLGEGSAILVLENKSKAELRETHIFAHLVGRSSTTDTQSITAPDETGNGAIRVIVQALKQGGLKPEDVNYLNSHGSGTPTNDAMEAKVYKHLFNKCGTPISSTKGAFGHTLGATGAMEALVAIMALDKCEAPPIANMENLMEEWREANIVSGSQPYKLMDTNVAVSVTYGFGGANASLVFKKLKEMDSN